MFGVFTFMDPFYRKKQPEIKFQDDIKSLMFTSMVQ